MKLTVFTPTYNRAYIIENLYRSLQRQTCHDFEWLVVDDGSSDHTEELFRAWQQEENPFPIRYFRRKTAVSTGPSTKDWNWHGENCSLLSIRTII